MRQDAGQHEQGQRERGVRTGISGDVQERRVDEVGKSSSGSGQRGRRHGTRRDVSFEVCVRVLRAGAHRGGAAAARVCSGQGRDGG